MVFIGVNVDHVSKISSFCVIRFSFSSFFTVSCFYVFWLRKFCVWFWKSQFMLRGSQEKISMRGEIFRKIAPSQPNFCFRYQLLIWIWVTLFLKQPDFRFEPQVDQLFDHFRFRCKKNEQKMAKSMDVAQEFRFEALEFLATFLWFSNYLN